MAMAMDWMIPICRASFCGLKATLGWSSVIPVTVIPSVTLQTLRLWDWSTFMLPSASRGRVTCDLLLLEPCN